MNALTKAAKHCPRCERLENYLIATWCGLILGAMLAFGIGHAMGL